MTISACAHCHEIIVRGLNDGPWRRVPDRGEVLFPDDAAACPKRPDRLPHQSPAEARKES